MVINITLQVYTLPVAYVQPARSRISTSIDIGKRCDCTTNNLPLIQLQIKVLCRISNLTDRFRMEESYDDG